MAPKYFEPKEKQLLRKDREICFTKYREALLIELFKTYVLPKFYICQHVVGENICFFSFLPCCQSLGSSS